MDILEVWNNYSLHRNKKPKKIDNKTILKNMMNRIMKLEIMSWKHLRLKRIIYHKL